MRRQKGYIPWVSVWTYGEEGLPRVLLLGDSIAWGYAGVVDERLKGQYYVDRLSTAATLDDEYFWKNIDLILGENEYEVILFNSGLHGGHLSLSEYEKGIEKFALRLKETGARLIFATTTPYWEGDKIDKVFEPDENGLYVNEGKIGDDCNKVIQRNKVALKVMNKYNIEVLDLFSFVNGIVEYRSGDGVHYNEKGWKALGEKVTEFILK